MPFPCLTDVQEYFVFDLCWKWIKTSLNPIFHLYYSNVWIVTKRENANSLKRVRNAVRLIYHLMRFRKIFFAFVGLIIFSTDFIPSIFVFLRKGRKSLIEVLITRLGPNQHRLRRTDTKTPKFGHQTLSAQLIFSGCYLYLCANACSVENLH